MCSDRHQTFHEKDGRKLDVGGKFLFFLLKGGKTWFGVPDSDRSLGDVPHCGRNLRSPLFDMSSEIFGNYLEKITNRMVYDTSCGTFKVRSS